MNTNRPIQVKISLIALYKNYLQCWSEIALDDIEFGESSIKQFQEVIEAVNRRDMVSLRKLFADGVTSMLLGSLMNVIDVERAPDVELRIYDGDRLMIVLVNDELNY